MKKPIPQRVRTERDRLRATPAVIASRPSDANYLAVGFSFFVLRFPNGLRTALFGTVSTFLTASRNRVQASGPS